jgi:archaellum biogenesis ATPase FlaH
MEDMLNEPDVMERIIIQQMFKDESFRNTVKPFISSMVFTNPLGFKLYEHVEHFITKFNGWPMVNDVRLGISDGPLKEYFNGCFSSEIDVSTFNKDHLIKNVENHIRNTLLGNEIMEVMENFDKINFADLATALPEKARDILNFTFDNSVGLDVFSEDGVDRMVEFFHQSNKFISTGISGLDAMISGGFHSKSLNLFMLPTNKGKSAIMGAIGANMVMSGHNVLYVTLEMPEEMIAHRVMSNILDVTQDSLKKFDRSTIKKKVKSVGSVINNRFRVKEFPTSGTSANTISRLIKDLKDKQNWVPDIIFVDYLGLMKPNNARSVSAKHEDLKTVSEELRDIGMLLDIPIVSAMQTNRGGYESTELDLSDMSESFGVAMTADVTIAGIMTDELRNIGQYIWRIIKNRFGQNQQEINVGMDFEKMALSDLGDVPRNAGEAGSDLHEPVQVMDVSAQVNKVKEDKDAGIASGLGGFKVKKKINIDFE